MAWRTGIYNITKKQLSKTTYEYGSIEDADLKSEVNKVIQEEKWDRNDLLIIDHISAIPRILNGPNDFIILKADRLISGWNIHNDHNYLFNYKTKIIKRLIRIHKGQGRETPNTI